MGVNGLHKRGKGKRGDGGLKLRGHALRLPSDRGSGRAAREAGGRELQGGGESVGRTQQTGEESSFSLLK